MGKTGFENIDPSRSWMTGKQEVTSGVAYELGEPPSVYVPFSLGE
jgi:hypothetical protein